MRAGALPLAAWIDARRERLDAALLACLPEPPRSPRPLHVAMRYSLRAGGKRLRPLLTLAAAEAILLDEGAAMAVALPAACAVELVHTYSLIHDDLPAMDDDTIRRGHPTSHVVFGEGLAILAGDALLTEAFALLAREPASHDGQVIARKLRAIGLLAEAAGAAGMVGGQVIDLQGAGQLRDPARTVTALTDGFDVRLVHDAASLQAMHARKTGALIRAAALAGAVMAGGDERTLHAVETFATDLGLAFQIVDDVLDVTGVAADLGKTSGKDAASGKPTYPALFGLERSRELAAEALDRALAALAGGNLDGQLPAIARWVVERRN